MKPVLTLGLAAAVIGLAASLSLATPPAARSRTGPADAEKASLAVLYAGTPGSARESEFVRFLEDHFERVEAGDFARFVPADADAFDVVILDFDGDGFKCPKPKIPRSYSRPTIMVSVAGCLLASSMGLKTGYL